MIERLLDRWFPRKLMGGKCPNIIRWTIYSQGPKGLRVYVHKFIGDDPSDVLHDHSSWFVSCGIWGSYLEHLRQGQRIWKAPWVRSFKATHAHRIVLRSRVAWTVVITGKRTRKSGFWVRGRWWLADVYRSIYPDKRAC